MPWGPSVILIEVLGHPGDVVLIEHLGAATGAAGLTCPLLVKNH